VPALPVPGADLKGYDSSTYGDRWAEVYDEWIAEQWSSPGDVEFLAELAHGGRALELGVGTGRVAIPLAEGGAQVVGIDASRLMLELLHAKTDRVATVEGEMADVAADGEFDLVYVVFNTFFALLTQDDQVRCFRNVAQRLKPDGVFVLQAFVPDLSRFERGQRVQARQLDANRVIIDASVHDPVAQTISTQALTFSGGELHMLPIHLRYAWPSELDLMAQLAGLRLRERYESFERRPFTATSQSHVSVYGR
jgi:SAM-dependent methyltransferase